MEASTCRSVPTFSKKCTLHVNRNERGRATQTQPITRRQRPVRAEAHTARAAHSGGATRQHIASQTAVTAIHRQTPLCIGLVCPWRRVRMNHSCGHRRPSDTPNGSPERVTQPTLKTTRSPEEHLNAVGTRKITWRRHRRHKPSTDTQSRTCHEHWSASLRCPAKHVPIMGSKAGGGRWARARRSRLAHARRKKWAIQHKDGGGGGGGGDQLREDEAAGQVGGGPSAAGCRSTRPLAVGDHLHG